MLTFADMPIVIAWTLHAILVLYLFSASTVNAMVYIISIDEKHDPDYKKRINKKYRRTHAKWLFIHLIGCAFMVAMPFIIFY
jgi:hypothetical protein